MSRLAHRLPARLGGDQATPLLSAASLVPQPVPVDLGFGQDFQVLGGVNPSFQLVGGYTNLGQALCMRLQTPRGGLFYDADYGFDLRSYLNAAITRQVAAQIVGGVQSECLKDERVQVCTATLSVDLTQETLTVAVNVVTAQGPFSFILEVTDATVTLIESQFNG